MENRLSGVDIAFDPTEEDDNSPSGYLTENTNPLTILETQDSDDDNARKLASALNELDERSRDIICKDFYLKKNQH